ncbi:MAG: GSU2086 family protein [Planctomycetota bacterium]|jgi:hypothetical protein
MKRRRAPDPSPLRTYPIRRRKSLVSVKDFGRPTSGRGAAEVLNSLPDIYAGKNLRTLVKEIARAHKRRKQVAVAMGGHVIKCGLGPHLIDLIRRGVITSVAMNGGASIHDYEISLIGKTSEDVAKGLKDGSFGMARETAGAYAEAAADGAWGRGLGRALGELILRNRNRHADLSVLAACARKGIPATVHVTIGADIVHMHPEVGGEALGESSMIDFRILTGVAARLERGVWLNVGSAVVLPEVFLKAVTCARNLGFKLKEFTTANLDFIQHYRPSQNVLARPRGRAIAITGHHEILIPLIHGGVRAILSGKKIR